MGGKGCIYTSNQVCLSYPWTLFSPLHSQFGFCSALEPDFPTAPDHHLFWLNFLISLQMSSGFFHHKKEKKDFSLSILFQLWPHFSHFSSLLSFPHLSWSHLHPSFLLLSLKTLAPPLTHLFISYHNTIFQQNPIIFLFKIPLKSEHFSPSPLPPCWSEPLASLCWHLDYCSYCLNGLPCGSCPALLINLLPPLSASISLVQSGWLSWCFSDIPDLVLLQYLCSYCSLCLEHFSFSYPHGFLCHLLWSLLKYQLSDTPFSILLHLLNLLYFPSHNLLPPDISCFMYFIYCVSRNWNVSSTRAGVFVWFVYCFLPST